MRAAPVVTATRVTKSYGAGNARILAVDAATVSVWPGAMLAITGHSGCGKTTLLHCLSTIAVPDGGTVRFGEEDVTEMGDADRARLRATAMGFVFQRFNLLPAMTVSGNVGLPLRVAGESRTQVRDAVDRVLGQFGLGDRASAYPHQLSGGQQQLAAVAVAVIAQPRVVWADEPTGALDSEAAARVLTALRQVADDGTAVVVVSHSPAVAEIADRVVVMADGRLAA